MREWDRAFQAERKERASLEEQARQWDKAYKALQAKLEKGSR